MNAASASSGPTTMQHPATVLRKWCESVKPIETSFGPDCGYCAPIYTEAVTIVTSGSAARQPELLAELLEERPPSSAFEGGAVYIRSKNSAVRSAGVTSQRI